MTSKPLRLKSLFINSLPGLPKGLKENLYNDLNADVIIIKGPNASGKSSTVRALLQALWSSKNLESDLSAQFMVAEDNWRVSIRYGRLEIYKNGEKTSETLPDGQLADRYNLSINDLLVKEEKDLAQKVLAEIYGGVDPNKVDAIEQYNKRSNYSQRSEVKGFYAADEKVKILQAEQEKLQKDEESIEVLRHQLKILIKKKEKGEVIAKAIRVLKIRSDHQKLLNLIEAFDPSMEALIGFRIEDLNTREKEKELRLLELRESEGKITRLNNEIQDLKINPTQITEIQVRTLEELKTRIERKSEEIHTLEAQIRQFKSELLNLSKFFKYSEDQDINSWPIYKKLVSFNMVDTHNLSRRLDQLTSKRVKLQAFKELETILQSAKTQETDTELAEENIDKAILLLSEWLKGQRDKNSLKPGAYFIFVLILLLALAMFHKEIHAENIIYIIGGTAGLSLLYYLTLNRFASGDSSVKKEIVRRGIHIENWEVNNVTQTIDKLLRNKAIIAENKKINESISYSQRSGIELEDEVNRLQQELQSHKDIITGQLNLLEEEVETRIIDHYLQRIYEWQESNKRYISAYTKYQTLTQTQENSLNKFNEILTDIGLAPCTHEVMVHACYADVRNLYQQSRALLTDLDNEKEKYKNINNYLHEINDIISDIYTEVGKSEDEKGDILQQLDGIKEYLSLKRQLEVNQVTLRQAESEYDEARKENTDDYLQMSIEELEMQLEEVKTANINSSDLYNRIGRIEGAVDSMRNKDELETAIQRRDEALMALENMYYENLRKDIGALLLNQIVSQNQTRNQPKVLYRANQILADITMGKYKIAMRGKASQPEFVGLDVDTGDKIPLDKLSSGTRIHLLMALRIASIEEQEKGGLWMMPLFADELLANSDEERTSAIIETLLKISESGRQVFYLTAQVDEVTRWHRHLRKLKGSITYKIVEIDESDSNTVSDWAEPHLFPDIQPQLKEDIPYPDSQRMEEYQRKLAKENIVIPQFNRLIDTIEEQHLYYFLKDAFDLYELISAKVYTWGQLKSLAEYYPDYKVIIEKHNVDKKALLLRKYRELYFIGRGKPMNRQVLKENGVTDAKLDEVEKLLIGCNYDTQLMAENLENIDGIGPKIRQAIVSNLKESRYLPEGNPLDHQEIERRLIAFSREIGLSQEEAHKFLAM